MEICKEASVELVNLSTLPSKFVEGEIQAKKVREPVKMDFLLMANHVVVADALGAAIMSILLKRTKHIVITEKESIGALHLENVKLDTDLSKFRREFRIRKTILDKASAILFPSYVVAKLIIDSPFTSLI